MKPNRFKYAKPRSLDETFKLLDEYGEGAMVLAGGQSLLAGLGMRLAAPEVLVDINGIEDLSGISMDGDTVIVRALTRHFQVLESPIIRRYLPLIADAITYVGHIGVRNRGTFGGSLSYADPAAELPACAVALGATIVIGGRTGVRQVSADDFFLGLMHTALQPGEIVLEVRIPKQRERQTHVFGELSRRHGDFAMVGLAGLLSFAEDRVSTARIVYFGCVSHPSVAQLTCRALVGKRLPIESLDDIEETLMRDLSPDDSPGLRSDTKLRLAAVMTRRKLNELMEA
jgi:aerobic carbon-monoxide dehydrogenase medium subunit